MSRTSIMSPMSNREVHRLLKDWGFQDAGFMGGHTIMQKDDRKVQITTTGRHTPTPYKALRKAASILGISLRDFLNGPIKEKKSMPTTVTPLPDMRPDDAPPKLVCKTCGKDTFVTLKGLRGHERTHQTGTCAFCGKEVSLIGLGPHEKSCKQRNPKKEEETVTGPVTIKRRRPGRPRHPIAEVPDKKAGKSNGLELEVPNFEVDEEFPPAEDFSFGETSTVEDFGHTLRSFLPEGVELDASLEAEFGKWLAATRSLLAEVAQVVQNRA